MQNIQYKSRTGGILCIVSGVFGVLYVGLAVLSVFLSRFFFSEAFNPFTPVPPPEFFTLMVIFYAIFGVAFALISTLGIVGGIFALKRKHWGVALAGAIAGTITFFPCGIAAVIFISMAQPEF